MKSASPRPKLIGLVRDANGDPVLDRHFTDYPKPVQRALASMMTEDEHRRALDGHYIVHSSKERSG